MIILFCLLVVCCFLVFVYLYTRISNLEKNVNELYDMYYKKEYNFEIKEKEQKDYGRRICEGFRSYMGSD